MQLGCLILCCSLLSQQSPPRSPVPPTRDDPATAGPLVPVDQRKPKLTPPRIVSDALTPLATEPLTGRALPLLEVLTRSATRPRQLAAVQSYWTLAAAVGEYHFSRRELEALVALATSAARPRGAAEPMEDTALAAERALAAARVQEALLRVTAAQAELADRVGAATGDRLLLPADEPHVGAYRTHFELLFATRAAPPRMHLLQRILPLRRKAIDVRAEAVQAALDSLVAAQEALERRETDAGQVADRLTQLARQQRAFLDSVRQYNHDIAEYALNVADANASPAAIQPMLIRPRESATPATPEKTNSAGTTSAGNTPAEVEPPRTSRPPGMRSLLRSESVGTDSQTNLKPPSGDALAQLSDTPLSSSDHESFAALLELSAPKRTHRLARLLHWDRALADASQSTMTLEQCLAVAAPAQRRQAVEAFWMAREHAARCQVFSDQSDHLAALYPATLGAMRRAGGAEAMLDLRVRQQATEADLLDSQAELWVRRLELATLVGRAGNPKDWPTPATSPHGGRYETRLEAQPQNLAQSPVVQQAASTLPRRYSALELRAEAVIRLDGLRATAIKGFESAQTRVDLWRPLDSIDRQATETLAFLSSLTSYNLAIANYALAILPANITPPELTSSLIVPSR